MSEPNQRLPHCERVKPPSHGEHSPESIREVLHRLLASRTFRAAEMQRQFLRYAVEESIAGRGHLIKEYVIGVEGLGRPQSFDPRLDPIVRTEARKLRARLAKYYATEGLEDRLRIDFPKGSYAPAFRCEVPESVRACPAAAAEAPAAPTAQSRNQGKWKFAALVQAAALAGVLLWIFAGRTRDRGPLSSNPAAFEAYERGRHFLNQFSPEGLRTARGYFERAIAEDATFARAYSALADSYVMAPQVLAADPPEVIAAAKEAARKALQLDRSLGDPHFDLAVCAEIEFDWRTAELEFQKGLQLSPGSAIGHLWYAKYLALMGRKSEVLKHRRMAAELDPASPYALQAVAGYFSVMGRYDQAIELFRGALAIEPRFGLAHQGLGVAYLLKGMHDEAIAELKAANETMSGPKRMALLGYAYGVAGQKDEANHILNGFLAESQRGPFPALSIAQVYIGLGDRDRAFEWLEKAVDQRDLDLTLQWDSPYEPLRTDPRYIKLLRRMNLVEGALRTVASPGPNGYRLPLSPPARY